MFLVNPTRWTLPFGILAITLVASPGRADDRHRVVLKGRGVELNGPTPVVVALKRAIPPGDYRLVPINPTSDAPKDGFPANVYLEGATSYLGTVLGRSRGDDETIFELRSDSSTSGPRVQLRSEAAGAIAITAGPDGETPFTKYRVDSGPKPFLFPVIGPQGIAYTRSFPMVDVAGEDRDHPHQRSFWFTHGKVNDVDFWAETSGHGSIHETSRPVVASGRAVGVLRTTDDWLGPDGKKICEDDRLTRFWDLGGVRLIDFEITIKASVMPVVFGDTKEGAFGLRVASSMDTKRKLGGKITNAEGVEDGAAWGKPSAWVDYVGPVDGKLIGIAIFNHPSSFRYPTPWHVRDYGLFAANPFGSKEFGIKPPVEIRLATGERLTLRYRVLLHTGDTPSMALPGWFRGYAESPGLELLED